MTAGTRIEQDAFGPVVIPSDRYWGAQTQRALGIFDIGEERFPAVLVRTFGLHKFAAARANLKSGALAPQPERPVRQCSRRFAAGGRRKGASDSSLVRPEKRPPFTSGRLSCLSSPK